VVGYEAFMLKMNDNDESEDASNNTNLARFIKKPGGSEPRNQNLSRAPISPDNLFQQAKIY